MRNRILSLSICLLLIGGIVLAEESGYQRTIRKVMESFKCNYRIAKNFVNFLGHNIRQVQDRFIQVVEERDAPKNIIEFTVNTYFTPGAEIQVTTLNSKKVKTFTIKEYLYRLTRLMYKRINLYFDPDYLSMSEIESYEESDGNKAYQFSVSMYQSFEGIFREMRYRDVTKKSWVYVLYKSDTEWVLRIRQITASETMSVEEYNEFKTTWYKD